MIHICADVRMVNSSGIGVYIQHYVQSLLTDGSFKVTLIGRRSELDNHFGPSQNGHYIDANFPIYSITEQLKLPMLVPTCDVFWSPHYNIPLAPIRARKRLVTIHDVFHLAYAKTLTTAQRFYAWLLTNRAAHQSDRVLTVSQFSAQEIIRYTQVDESKLNVILSGVDKDLFSPVKTSSNQAYIERKYNVAGPYALFVGNVKLNKNLRRLVDGFATILAELPDLKLVITGKQEGFITGDPALFARIKADQALASRIVFTGFVDTQDLPVLYSLAHLFVFPSVYEGFGFPPVEAMACGCPVVASNASSIPEICGEAAWYVDPLDPTDIARGIRTVATDTGLRSQLTDAGYRQSRRYDWHTASKQFTAVIKELANR